jgi:Aldo/keto reductase family
MCIASAEPRAGRRRGIAIAFCSYEERPYLREIEKLTRRSLPSITVPSATAAPRNGPIERPAPSNPPPARLGRPRRLKRLTRCHAPTSGRQGRAAAKGGDKGVTFIDTAASYGPGISVMLIAKAHYPYPAGLMVATKGGLTRPGADRWVAECRPEHLRRACADSLRRLRLERIELYQLHTVDHRIPIEDSFGALVDLQHDGKIRHIGVSNVSERELAPGTRRRQNRFRPELLQSSR